MRTHELACAEDRRSRLIRERKLNGIESVDVSGAHLCVHFLTGIPPEFQARKHGAAMSPAEKAAAMAHIVITGGRRIKDIHPVDVDPDEARSKYEEACLGIQLDKEGDWSTYRLCLVETRGGRPTDVPLKSLDPRYACIDVTFRTECAAEIDCGQTSTCATEERPAPEISYLAKDYATFRQLILDRLALTMPDWRERHIPDVGVALVEILAYAADYLSYAQDAAGTEQYLDTARQRISVRRHARLVDYRMHEGCNARVFISLQVAADDDTIRPRDVYFVTALASSDVALRQSDLAALPEGWLQFEPLPLRPTLKLRAAHNLIRIYTWGDERCCLARGATSATLLDEAMEHDSYDPAICDERPWPPTDHCHDDKCGCGEVPPPKPPAPRVLDLEAGDFLLFEELACAGAVDSTFDGMTRQPDADRTHRQVVRLTKVTRNCDALKGNRVLDVEWCVEDALLFPLCISAIGAAPVCELVTGLGIARGNIVPADHGRTVFDEPLPPVIGQPQPDVCEAEDSPADVLLTPRRYRPHLRLGPLTFSEPVRAGACATTLLRQDPRAAIPAITLAGIPSANGVEPLYASDALENLRTFAAALIAAVPGDPLYALRRRLRGDVRQLIDGKDVDKLLAPLDDNLRALTEAWIARPDLLDSGRDDPEFVAEVDDLGTAYLRYGDDNCGRAVDVGMAFVATYRVGNGRAGVVGPESIAHVVYRSGFSTAITGVRNPLPSAGATDPEPIAEVKMYAPGAFRNRLERAVTPGDYAAVAQYGKTRDRNPKVQSASAALNWTGSWYEADVAIDQLRTSDLDPALASSIQTTLERYRRMGHDLRVGSAEIVPLRLVIDLCVKPDYLQSHVVAAVGEALGRRSLAGGRRGFFHPDRLTFGGSVSVSQIVAAVMQVEGVAEARVVRLERLGHERVKNPDFDKGLLILRSTEIARLDNDPSAPENGLLTFRRVRGGR